VVKRGKEQIMKVCHIVPYFQEQIGGSERYLSSILPYLKKLGVDLTVVTTTMNKSKVGVENQNGISIKRFFTYKNVWNINPIANILPYLVKEDFDILHVHSHLYFISNQAIMSKFLKKKRIITHLHGGIGIPPFKTTFSKKLAKLFYDKTLTNLTFNNSDVIGTVAYNDFKSPSISEKHKKKLFYMPNVVDYDLFNGLNWQTKYDEEERFHKILFVGDLEAWKGIEYIKKVITLFNKKPCMEKPIEFTLIGQGSYFDELTALRYKLNDDCVRLNVLGQIPHEIIPKFYHNTDIMFFPSLWEATPTVILEAMASGTPIVTTNVGDVPYLIQDKKNGFITKFDANIMAEKILEALNDKESKKNFKNANQKIIKENYNSEISSKSIFNIYRSIV
jgi:glycosyltransferase involved in cell wall biosynthesis